MFSKEHFAYRDTSKLNIFIDHINKEIFNGK